MPDCEYCADSFDDEDAYLDHLADCHRGELGRIDQRRVEAHVGSGDGSGDGNFERLVLYGVGIVTVAVILGLVALVVASGGNGSGDVHYHGYVDLTVDGESYDFDQPDYHGYPPVFHFHANQGPLHEDGPGYYWHMHPEQVSIETAMTDLGFEMDDTSIVVDGETYDDEAASTTVAVEVNGEPEDATYEPEDGDEIAIIVETADE